MPEQILQKPLSPWQIFRKTWEIIRTDWFNLIAIIFLALIILSLVILIITSAWSPLWVIGVIKTDYIFTFRLIWQAITLIILYLISALIQILMINSLLNPQLNLKGNLRSIKNYFWQFLLLMIILNILLLLAALPIYVGVFFLLLQSYFLGILSLLISFILIIFLCVYLIFSPFILIENKLSWHEAMLKSLALSQGYFGNLFLKIAILILILVGLNYLSIFLLTLGLIGLILSGLFTIAMIIFAFPYLLALYQEIKSLKQVT
ncbi:MAG: hypothetical protein NTX00_01625 [Candidatus Parcubacteria bacterium]|nr:hypothetical protein [Candidatus Parcubacteria bacterium]